MSASRYEGMSRIEGFPFPVWASPGAEERAEEIGARTSRALGWLTSAFGEPRDVELGIPDRSDWERVADVPVYGMPQAFGNRVTLSPDPAGFWQEAVDILWPDLSESTREALRGVYGDPPDVGARLADLIAVHELTHLYHEYDETTGRTDFPRLWLAELFSSIGMYGYLADEEPELLPIVSTIARATREIRREHMPVIELDDMERTFEFGAVYYVLYQFLLIEVAERIWEAAGIGGLREFRDRLRSPEMTDEEIVAALGRIHPEAARVVTSWPDLVEAENA